MSESSIRKNEKLESLRIEEHDGVPTLTIRETMPIEQFARISADICNIHSDYKKSDRNAKAVEHGKLAKHMMHLLRLYMMGIDILESGRIVTYREAEHELLMDVRSGKYLCEDGTTPTPEFEEVLGAYTERFEKAAETTDLPKNPDMERANALMMGLVRSYYRL